MQRSQPSRIATILALLGLLWGVHPTAEAGTASRGLEHESQEEIGDILLEKPLKASLRMRSSDEVVTVSIDHWDAEGLHGAHGVIAWEQIQYESQQRVFHKLMDRTAPNHWILLGELQLAHSEGLGKPEAARSFELALKLDPSAAERIESARKRAVAQIQERAAAAAQALRERNQAVRAPGGPGWQSAPWKPLSFEQARAQLRVQRSMVEDCLLQNGLDAFHVHDAGWLLIFTDLPALELAEVLEDLDTVRRLALSPFAKQSKEASFRGKVILILCDEADDSARIEESCFDSSVGSEADASCHAMGPSIFINLHHDGDHPRVLARLLGQLFVAAQHHHVSPAPLPRWAFEGLRDHVITRLEENAPLDQMLRPLAHQYIRDGGDLHMLLNRASVDEAGPEVERVFRAVAYLTCSLMMRENPEGFSNWIHAVKSGASWKDALTQWYGVDFDQILHVTREWYLLND